MAGKTVIAALVAFALVLPSAFAANYTCGPFTAKDTKCEHALSKGDKFTLDCTGSTNTVPATLLAGSLTAAKVCSEKAARTAVAGACAGSEITLDAAKGKNLAVTASSTGITITNTDYKETSDMILAGSCTDSTSAATKSGYFSITLKKASSSSAHGTRVGLAAATGVALLGLAAF